MQLPYSTRYKRTGSCSQYHHQEWGRERVTHSGAQWIHLPWAFTESTFSSQTMDTHSLTRGSPLTTLAEGQYNAARQPRAHRRPALLLLRAHDHSRAGSHKRTGKTHTQSRRIHGTSGADWQLPQTAGSHTTLSVAVKAHSASDRAYSSLLSNIRSFPRASVIGSHSTHTHTHTCSTHTACSLTSES